MIDKVLIINTGGTIGMVNSEKEDPNSLLRPLTTGMKLQKNTLFLKNFNRLLSVLH